MKWNRYDVADLILVLGSFVVSALLYPSVPDLIPTHWNLKGVPNGFTPKPWGAFLSPLISLGLCLLLYILPKISPKSFSMTPFQHVYDILRTVIFGFLFIINAVILLSAAGYPLPINQVVMMSVGILLIILGNFMGKVTKNFFVGIRTPWTLANDEVWLRTHRLGGKLFVAAGFIILLSGILRRGEIIAIIAVFAATAISAIYSYVIYRRLEGFKEEPIKPGNQQIR